MHEWTLLIFTISMQAAIGGLTTLWLFQRKVERDGGDATPLLKTPLLVICVISLLGLASSFFHLGKPTHALNTMLGLGHSWMSREILLTGIFIGLVCLMVMLLFVSNKVNHWLLLATSIIGLVDVFAMASIYSHTLVNGWGHINTFLSFYGTTFTLGAILIVSVTALTYKHTEYVGYFRRVGFLIASAGIAVQLIGTGTFTGFKDQIAQIEGVQVSVGLEMYQGWMAARWIIESIGVAILGYYTIGSAKKLSNSLIYTALVAIMVGEVLSRYVFYVLGA